MMVDGYGNGKKIAYLLGAPVGLADIVSILEMLQDLGHGGLLFTQLLHLQGLTTTLGLLVQVLEGLLDELDILDAQLLADDGQITDGVDITLDVNDLRIIETTDDLEDGIDGANVRQKGVTETGTGGGTAGQTGDIIDGQVGRHLRLGLVVFAQPVEPVIGDDDTGFFGVDGGIGEVGGVTQRGLGDGLEEGGFADVGKTDLRN